MSRNKKSGNKNHTLEKLVLITAAIQLIHTVIDLIKTLLE